MKIWLLIAQSCEGCDTRYAKAFTNEPTQDDVQALADLVNLNCVAIHNVRLEVDGHAEETT